MAFSKPIRTPTWSAIPPMEPTQHPVPMTNASLSGRRERTIFPSTVRIRSSGGQPRADSWATQKTSSTFAGQKIPNLLFPLAWTNAFLFGMFRRNITSRFQTSIKNLYKESPSISPSSISSAAAMIELLKFGRPSKPKNQKLSFTARNL